MINSYIYNQSIKEVSFGYNERFTCINNKLQLVIYTLMRVVVHTTDLTYFKLAERYYFKSHIIQASEQKQA